MLGMLGAAIAQIPATPQASNPSPELVGALTNGLKINQQQAVGGAGSIFGLAKSKLNAADFSKIAAVVPGMDGLLKAAPAPPKQGNSALGSLSSALPSGAGNLASLAGAFQSLGLSPDMVSKFVPVMTQFVQSKGGASVASLLSGVLK
jgi:hypothetical protein